MKNNNSGFMAAQVSEGLKILLGIVIIGLSVYFLVHAAHFFSGTPEALGKYFELKWILFLHIGCGGVALLSGPFQLWGRFRTYNIRLHKALGKLYVFAILIGGICAVVLSATTAYDVTWAYAFSLQVWVGVWLTATFVAYNSARRKKIKLHQEWMVRSYIITVAFVISALLYKIPAVQQLGNFAETAPSLFWVGWAVPLFVYELYLTSQRGK